MSENYRSFEAGPDPFGRRWSIEFRWLQTGISIRHADTVDVKFAAGIAGERRYEKIIALRHPDLLRLAEETGHPLTDGWCLKLAALHLKYMIDTADDMEKSLVTVEYPVLKQYAARLKQAA